MGETSDVDRRASGRADDADRLAAPVHDERPGRGYPRRERPAADRAGDPGGVPAPGQQERAERARLP
ncbi:hypothetical protein G6F50_018577 [Rhizopus delemar]|uniref:Uncharacterized protein n=1 Tax=Rhizopus delemar TaxID=936053 RepID=A0A9P7BY46_9FUNG|nr:hypothetical protein G6F50_018577 [Rhizopus delemar]